MKGVVLELLGRCARDAFGEQAWQRAIAQAGLAEPFDQQRTYPDAEFNALVAAVATERGIGIDDAQRWFGESAVAHFHAMAPHLFDQHQDSWSFLLTLNDIIHPQVRRDFPGASAPDFGFDANEAGELVMTYHSQRRMCAFAEGLILASMRHYDDPPELRHVRCMHRGDPHCEFVLTALQT
ncbi:heme NO-binding domain-containing protein [Luteimonas vadosa]|uniref:Heme NO-binding domain-containing protein n=1 Tax=Luteimonas vadosa TaxID=1165507 RepID=A0ABP9DTT3_9GAMM